MAIRISPILQMRPLSSRKIEVICLRSICGKWKSQVLTPYGPEPQLLIIKIGEKYFFFPSFLPSPPPPQGMFSTEEGKTTSRILFSLVRNKQFRTIVTKFNPCNTVSKTSKMWISYTNSICSCCLSFFKDCFFCFCFHFQKG